MSKFNLNSCKRRIYPYLLPFWSYNQFEFSDITIYVVHDAYFIRCKSCNHVTTTDDVEDWVYHQLEDTTHLLHGVVHSNGYGHLLRVNGREGGSRVLSGSHIMDFWDRLCKALGVRLGFLINFCTFLLTSKINAIQLYQRANHLDQDIAYMQVYNFMFLSFPKKIYFHFHMRSSLIGPLHKYCDVGKFKSLEDYDSCMICWWLL